MRHSISPLAGSASRRRLGCGLLLLAAVGGLAGCALERPQPLIAERPMQKEAVIGTEKRVALVIGNANYPSAPLQNPINDARSIGTALRELGFEVRLLLDASARDMAAAAREFGDALPRDGVGLFYYAGHAMQIKGRNYLIPVGADIRREDEVAYNAFDAGQLLEKMESARSRVNIVILDACRNNPFARSFRSASQGLAQMDAPVGSYIAFATAPAKVASDGDGKNGLYTQHLLQSIRTPGLKIEEVFKQVRVRVMEDSKGQQIPWDSSSLAGDFYFAPPATLSAQQVRPVASSAAASDTAAAESKGREMHRQTADRVRIVSDGKAAEARPAAAASHGAKAVAAPAATAAASATPAVAKIDRATVESAAALYKQGMAAKAAGDIAAAAAAFGSAAEARHAGGAYELGLLLRAGRKPVAQDLPRSQRMFLLAAEQGNVAAQHELAQNFARGSGVASSCSEAGKWALKAAQGGSVDAALLLGELFRVDCGASRKNPDEAARWLRVAADKGVAKAQFSLGVMYVNGEGVKKDVQEARKWLTAAAGKGYPSARFYLERLGF